jgi:hypothetical protein
MVAAVCQAITSLFRCHRARSLCAPFDCTTSLACAASRSSCWFSVASSISGPAFVAVARCASSLTCLECSLQKLPILQQKRALILFRVIVVAIALAFSVRFVAYLVAAGAAAAFDFLRHHFSAWRHNFNVWFAVYLRKLSDNYVSLAYEPTSTLYGNLQYTYRLDAVCGV